MPEVVLMPAPKPINVDAFSLMFAIAALLLVPLLLSGFFSH